MTLTKEQLTAIAKSIGLGYPEFAAFIQVESGGAAFINGKIVIQFEPAWFKHYAATEYALYVKLAAQKEHTDLEKSIIDEWSFVLKNKVEGQAGEWVAFNNAFKINQKAALLSTSIGLMQIMGFHFVECGYKTVNEMWDAFKASEYNQVEAGAKFIKSNKPLYMAIKEHNWAKAAYYYNGSNYKVNNYDKRLEAAYNKLK
jgi:hypothetical protein